MALTIHLPDRIHTYIRQQIEQGRFPSEEAVIANAMTQVMDEYRWEKDDDLLAAIADVDRGEAVAWTDELRAQILRESEDAANRGDVVPDEPHVLIWTSPREPNEIGAESWFTR